MHYLYRKNTKTTDIKHLENIIIDQHIEPKIVQNSEPKIIQNIE